MFTIEKDDFTGLKTINSKFYGLNQLMAFDGPSDMYLRYMTDKTGISDAFDLLYLESENGQGKITIRVCSSVAKFSGNKDWPHWDDNWPMIIDGERLSLTSATINSFETNYELKAYDLPIDIFSKICNAKEIKFSLRGRNNKIEGVFTPQHQIIFRAFEQYCFGDENEGKKLLESISSFVSSSNSSNNQNVIVRPKELTDEERNNHENKVVDLIKEKKIEDAIKYYASNFELAEDTSRLKVKELAERNGLASIITANNRKNAIIGLIFYIPAFSYLSYLGGLPSSEVPFPVGLWVILILIFGILSLRSVIKLFKK
jgi:hypothetical protein